MIFNDRWKLFSTVEKSFQQSWVENNTSDKPGSRGLKKLEFTIFNIVICANSIFLHYNCNNWTMSSNHSKDCGDTLIVLINGYLFSFLLLTSSEINFFKSRWKNYQRISATICKYFYFIFKPSNMNLDL